MTAHDLPTVDPMLVRRFTPRGLCELIGGVLVMDAFDVEDVGPVPDRLPFDAPVVECSRRIFDLTTRMMMLPKPLAVCVFPSRRWRNFRTDQSIEREPDVDHPLLYLGNPIRLFSDEERGIFVERRPEFLIKSGIELGF